MNEERKAVTEDEAFEALLGRNPVIGLDEPRGARGQRLLAVARGQDGKHRRAAGKWTIALAGSMAVVAAVVVASVVATTGGGGSSQAEPGDGTAVSVDVGGGATMASCAFLYSPETLAEREYAFDGVVTKIDGPPGGSSGDPDDESPNLPYDAVTFAVNEWFKGDGGDVVTLESMATAAGVVTSVEPVGLEEGAHYLVSGDGGFVWTCGFTKTYSESMADEWREATR